MSFKKGLFKNILIAGGYAYLSQAISFLSTIVLSRILTPNSYGLVNLITVFTGFILVFSDGGLSYALIRSDFGETYNRVLTNLSWLLGFSLFIITTLVGYPISLFYHNSSLILPTMALGTTFLIKGLSLTQGAVLAKQLNFAYIGKVTLISVIITVALTIILAYCGLDYWSLIIPQIVAAIVIAIMYERKVKLGFKIYHLNYILVVYRHTKKLIGSVIGFNTINYWARNTDNMIVGKWYGTSSLGIYNRAYNLLMLPLTLISGLFSNILFPSLKKLKQQGGNIEEEYYFVLRVITILTFPIVVILITFPNQLVLLLWGNKWKEVAIFLPYFGLLIFTQTLLSTVGQLLILDEKESEFMISGWVGSAFLVAGIIIGAFISLIGVAQFYSLSYIFVLIFNIIFLYIRTLKFNVRTTLGFWIPKIAFSFVLWIAIFFKMELLKMASVVLICIYIIFVSRKEIKLILSKASLIIRLKS